MKLPKLWWSEWAFFLTAPVVVVALVVAMVLFAPRAAECTWCVHTFCATDVECPINGCHCCIPDGKVTGECC